jgi:ankyrin repeat protein
MRLTERARVTVCYHRRRSKALKESLRAFRLTSCLVSLFLFGPVLGADADHRLLDAAKRRDQAAVRSLLQASMDVNVRQPDGATALPWAAHWDD